MAKIIIPTPLRKFTDNQSSFSTSAATVQEAVVALATKFPGLSKHILDEQNNIRGFIRIFVGEDDINELNKSETLVSTDAIISIVPAIAGGIF